MVKKVTPAKKPVAKKVVPAKKPAPKKVEIKKASSLEDLKPPVDNDPVQEAPNCPAPQHKEVPEDAGTPEVDAPEPETEDEPEVIEEAPAMSLAEKMKKEQDKRDLKAQKEGYRVGNRYNYQTLEISDLKVGSGDTQRNLFFEPLEVKNLLEFFTIKQIMGSRMLRNRMLANPKLGGKYGELLEITEGMDGIPNEMIIREDYFKGVNVRRQVDGMGGVGNVTLRANENNFYSQAIIERQKKEDAENKAIGKDVT